MIATYKRGGMMQVCDDCDLHRGLMLRAFGDLSGPVGTNDWRRRMQCKYQDTRLGFRVRVRV